MFWTDGAGRSPPRAPPPHPCTLRVLILLIFRWSIYILIWAPPPTPPPSPTLLILSCHGFRCQPELIILTLIIGLISSPITYQLFENSFLLSLLINNSARYEFLGYSPSSLFRPLKILLQHLQNLRHIWYFTSWISFDFFSYKGPEAPLSIFLNVYCSTRSGIIC